jgi:hypothetical protein
MTMTRELMSELDLQVPDFTGAACAGMDGDMFYDDMIANESSKEYGKYTSSAPKQHAMLRRVCLKCPIVNECAAFAIKHERFGFWGGLTAMERSSMRTMNNILLEEIDYKIPVVTIINMNREDGDDEF